MKVNIKSFNVKMEVKSSGVEFEVRSANGKTMLGDCYLTMSGFTWCQGKTDKKNGVRISWQDFISVMSSNATIRAAVKAAKDETG